ncbi:MAG: hypothetical protein H6Q19_1815 [Bacteroidetes bacterium]|nr:hypothetical protein [Bacteroidota bacterium]
MKGGIELFFCSNSSTYYQRDIQNLFHCTDYCFGNGIFGSASGFEIIADPLYCRNISPVNQDVTGRNNFNGRFLNFDSRLYMLIDQIIGISSRYKGKKKQSIGSRTELRRITRKEYFGCLHIFERQEQSFGVEHAGTSANKNEVRSAFFEFSQGFSQYRTGALIGIKQYSKHLPVAPGI